MRPARFVIRFDDICPTINWDTWNVIELCLTQLQLRPLLAVVPDNRDPDLEVGRAEPRFWERVRGWQARGWAIGLHGYQHRYETQDGGLIGLNPKSEFAGLPADEQAEKLRLALAVFSREGVRPDAWVAPGHSFDGTTVRLLQGYGLRVISDGFTFRPVTDALGMTWIPQQLWRLRPRPFGVWTACYHSNELTLQDLSVLASDFARFQDRITSVAAVFEEHRGGKASSIDIVAAWALRHYVLGRRGAGRRLRAARSTA
jgi:predicted deacetylase